MDKRIKASKDNERLCISIEEMAATIGVGRNVAHALVKKDGFPCFKIGVKTFVVVDELRVWLRKQIGTQVLEPERRTEESDD